MPFSRHGLPMVISFHPAVAPILALIAGIVILLVPRLLHYMVAGYFILIGILGLLGHRL